MATLKGFSKDELVTLHELTGQEKKFLKEQLGREFTEIVLRTKGEDLSAKIDGGECSEEEKDILAAFYIDLLCSF